MPESQELTIGTWTNIILPAFSGVHLRQLKVAGFDESHVLDGESNYGTPSYLERGYELPVRYVVPCQSFSGS